jgi:ParB/RepB/Spo0J family partition protein
MESKPEQQAYDVSQSMTLVQKTAKSEIEETRTPKKEKVKKDTLGELPTEKPHSRGEAIELPSITLISLSQIELPQDWKPGDSFTLLKSSIEELGLLSPISVIKIAGEVTKYEIIAGRDRVNAASELGWKEIPAIIQEFNSIQSETAEIDENLFRKILSALRTAVQLLKRRNLHTNQHKGEVTSPTQDFAAQMGLSPRSIQQYMFIAEKLAPDVIEALWGTPFEDRKEDLLALARLDHAKQRACVEKIQNGNVSTLAKILQPVESPTPQATHDGDEAKESETNDSGESENDSKGAPDFKHQEIHYLGDLLLTQEQRQSSFLESLGKQRSLKTFCVFEIGFEDQADSELLKKINKYIARTVETANKTNSGGAK